MVDTSVFIKNGDIEGLRTLHEYLEDDENIEALIEARTEAIEYGSVEALRYLCEELYCPFYDREEGELEQPIMFGIMKTDNVDVFRYAVESGYDYRNESNGSTAPELYGKAYLTIVECLESCAYNILRYFMEEVVNLEDISADTIAEFIIYDAPNDLIQWVTERGYLSAEAITIAERILNEGE